MERVRLGRARSRVALIGLATAACAVVLGAVLAFWLPGRPGSVGATVQPAQVAADPRMLACEKNSTRTIDDVMQVFELSHGRDYRTYLRVPVQPDLMSADQPALVVVFKTGDSSFSSGGNPPLEFTPPPGTHTVCVALTGAATTVFLPNLAAPAIGPLPGTEPSGPVATVFARLNRSVAAMAWDPGRHALWMVTWRSYSDGRLSRVGLDGSVQNWALPGGPNVQSSPAIQAGLVQPEQPLAWYGFDATDIVVDRATLASAAWRSSATRCWSANETRLRSSIAPASSWTRPAAVWVIGCSNRRAPTGRWYCQESSEMPQPLCSA
jgi:hypothetical protein